MSVSSESYESIGTDRFLIQQKLGSGAFGDVFRAYDHELETIVALKTLHRAEPAAIYHFKNEFRSLAGVTHPHLVQLYELLSVNERWYFTMELVDGLDFIEYAGSSRDDLSDTTQIHPLPSPVVEHDFARLRHALRQLAEGLRALHRAGKLHCDIKPTNLRITPDGRLVLLDFGLVHDLEGQMFQTMAGEVRGTPAYMSPEQAMGREVTEASDWYAVGGVLYEALTGELPFSGSVLRVLKDKLIYDGPSPRKRIPYLPDDLADLCTSLLARDSARRPTGEQILDRLGGRWTGLTEVVADHGSGLFVGREMQLATLHESFDLTRGGEAAAVFVRGSSGMGKTALVSRFVEQVRHRHPDLVVLAARCYEQESVPYKGLDALIDTLSRYLKHLSYDQAAALIPTQVQALVRLFPALERVEAVAAAPRGVLGVGDEREQRRRARSALHKLLERLAERSPLLLFIDDLQWDDRDSAEMLADLLTPPGSPALMLVGCYRDEDSGRPPHLRQILAREEEDDDAVRELCVRRLWFSEACELGLKLLGERRTPALDLARAIARESGGSPFFITELVRYARSELGWTGGGAIGPDAAAIGLSLENLIRSRVTRLPFGARRLLELVAIAGRPLALSVAVAAAELEVDSQTMINLLLAGSLLRLRGSPRRELETYHDRIRETVLLELDETRRARLHGRLARALQATGRADPETLASHFHAAGDRERATDLAVAAAEQAVAALAFDRAARLYRLALKLVADGTERRRLQVALGDALLNAGRRPAAGRAGAGARAVELTRSDPGSQTLQSENRFRPRSFAR